MPSPHQVTASVLTSTDQVPGCFLVHGGHRDRSDLVQAQQPGQVHRVLASVLTRSPEGRCSFDGATTSQRTPTAFNDRDNPNPVGPAS
jgi:hypothetical protein